MKIVFETKREKAAGVIVILLIQLMVLSVILSNTSLTVDIPYEKCRMVVQHLALLLHSSTEPEFVLLEFLHIFFPCAYGFP